MLEACFRKEGGAFLGPLMVPKKVLASPRAAFCEGAVP